MTPEGKVKAEIKAGLKQVSAYQYWPVPMGMGGPSVDVYVCFQGLFHAIEVKRPRGGKTTARQEKVLREVRAAGGYAFVARSWAEVADYLGVEE